MRLHEHGRPTRVHARILLLAWGAWLTGFYSLMLPSFLLAALRAELGLSEGELAVLSGVGVGMTGAGGFLFGWLSDRFGRRPSLVLAVAVFSAGNLLCGLAPGTAALLLGRAVAGLGVGGTWGAGQAMIGETFPAGARGRFGALAQSGAPLGFGLAAAVGSFAAPAVGWRPVFVGSALPAVLLLFHRRLPESDVWLEYRRRLRGGALSGPERRRAALPILAQAVAPDLAGRTARAFLLTALNMAAYWFAVIWLPRYLQEQRGMSIFGTGWWTLTFVGGSLLGYLTFGAAADALGRRLAFSLYCVVTAIGLAMVTLWWRMLADRPALGLGMMVVAGFGTGTWSCFGPYLSELFPTRVRGAVMSVLMNASRGVMFLAPIVIAAVAGRWGLAGGVALAAGFALLAAGWIWTLPETAGIRIDAPEEAA